MDYVDAFKGYAVPENIKNIAILISKRFAINGICDPMYISNVVAYTCGIGDGKGNFTGGDITKSRDIAERIQDAYGCNILKAEVPELTQIIESGEIAKPVAIQGAKNFIERLNQEMKVCAEWRKDHLTRTVENLNRVLLEWS